MNYPVFFNEDQINPVLISDVGENNVAIIASDLKQNSRLNSNQLRKFYDSFLRIYNANIDVNTKKIQLLMLKANAEYSAGRLKTKPFADFLKDRINIVLNQDQDFDKYIKALKLHLEALVAYFPKN
jgi:CRISPR type III-A-associated protein Csm2